MLGKTAAWSLLMTIALFAPVVPASAAGPGDDVTVVLEPASLWLGDLGSVDADDVPVVFAAVVAALPPQVLVLPSENYLYFTFLNEGALYRGNLRLDPVDRDDGKVHFAYYARLDATHYQLLGPADGVILAQAAPLTYLLRTAGSAPLRITLDDLSQAAPAPGLLAPGEQFVFRTTDESRYPFLLAFDTRTDSFRWLLDEARPLPEQLLPAGDGILVGERSGFAFAVDRAHGERKVLAAVRASEARGNTYYDGPFDQLADNAIVDGSFQALLERAFPGLAGRIDARGLYLDQDGARVAVAPYAQYTSLAQLPAAAACALRSSASCSGQPGADTFDIHKYQPSTYTCPRDNTHVHKFSQGIIAPPPPPVGVAVGVVCGLFPEADQPGPWAAYHSNPVEHDDQGRSDEPDRRATAVFGPTVRNCVADPYRTGRCTPDGALPPPGPAQSQVIAPGCTGEAGRQPSGLCGLRTVGAGAPLGVVRPGPTDWHVLNPGVAGEPGMPGSAAPGALTPSKNTQLRFLDARVDYRAHQALVGYQVDLNHKLEDAGVSAALAGFQRELGGAMLPASAGMWAWHGVWQDKNGNGVIDHRSGNGGQADPVNEFVWRGRCLDVNATVNLDNGGVCQYEDITLVDYVYPGDHSAACGIEAEGLCGPSALPGGEVLNRVHQTGTSRGCTDPPVHLIGPSVSSGPPVDLPICGTAKDLFGPDFALPVTVGPFDDPTLGPQNTVGPDEVYTDSTGARNETRRGWVRGLGAPTYAYDHSAVTTTVQFTAVVSLGAPACFNDGACFRFRDVDVWSTWNPALDEMVQGTVKPSLRSQWVFVEGLVP